MPTLRERNNVLPGFCFKLLQKTKGEEKYTFFTTLADMDNH